MRPALLLLGFWVLVVATASSAPNPINNGTGEASPNRSLRCGHVYDGDKLIYDLDHQVSTSTITANWFGFENPGILIQRYMWAVVSEDLVDDDFFADSKKRCRSHLDIQPDVMDWTNVGIDTTAKSTTVDLKAGKRYFVLVRALYSNGQESITNSDGVRIAETETELSAPGVDEEGQDIISISLEDLATAASGSAAPKSVRDVESTQATEQSTCSIDIMNHCRNARMGVGAILTELYGPPIFVRDPSIDENVNVLFSIESSSSTEGLSDGAVAGIIIACIIAFLILFLPLYCLKGKGKSNKFQTNPNRTENIENI